MANGNTDTCSTCGAYGPIALVFEDGRCVCFPCMRRARTTDAIADVCKARGWSWSERDGMWLDTAGEGVVFEGATGSVSIFVDDPALPRGEWVEVSVSDAAAAIGCAYPL